MLCLGRKEGERILIEGGIVILVRRIKGKVVTVAIDAPGRAIVRENAKQKEAA
jgi:sRNA-binding carbon storage regulator CsrA